MLYLDTSAAVPMFVPEPASEAIDAWFSASTEVLVSADWIRTEFASALSMKVRRGELDEAAAQAAWRDFEEFCDSGLRLLPVSRQSFATAARLARDARSGLRAGDSLHLAMALEAGATAILTADGNLDRNARANGLAVHRF
jgi:predicted nucleic acid-binding protein